MATQSRTLTYRPALAWFAGLGSAWVFVLVTLGAFTTSIGAGMAFEDWPLSNGSINPEGWLTDIMMFAEHSHRLSGTTMGLITIALAVWLTKVDPRAWVRRLGWAALAIVVIQGLIGGFRVTLHEWHVPGFTLSVGEMLKIPHGILAQVFVCILFAIAGSVSQYWIQTGHRTAPPSPLLRWAVISTALVGVQLVIAAVMRHNHAGMAIPTFPLTPEGDILPARWDFRVGLAFAHRAMALVLAVVIGRLTWWILRERVTTAFERMLAWILIALLLLQILLGAVVIWTTRNPYYTTGHVICGAFVLAVTFLVTWVLHREAIVAKERQTA